MFNDFKPSLTDYSISYRYLSSFSCLALKGNPVIPRLRFFGANLYGPGALDAFSLTQYKIIKSPNSICNPIILNNLTDMIHPLSTYSFLFSIATFFRNSYPCGMAFSLVHLRHQSKSQHYQ